MIEKDVYSKPEKFEAKQFDGTPDMELAQWCVGSYSVSIEREVWILNIQYQIAREGDWVLKEAGGTFFIVPAKAFKETYVEKVSYEDQSD